MEFLASYIGFALYGILDVCIWLTWMKIPVVSPIMTYYIAYITKTIDFWVGSAGFNNSFNFTIDSGCGLSLICVLPSLKYQKSSTPEAKEFEQITWSHLSSFPVGYVKIADFSLCFLALKSEHLLQRYYGSPAVENCGFYPQMKRLHGFWG